MIVGRVTEPMMEAVSLPPKEVTNKFPSYLLGVVELVSKRRSDTIVFRGNKLFLSIWIGSVPNSKGWLIFQLDA